MGVRDRVQKTTLKRIDEQIATLQAERERLLKLRADPIRRRRRHQHRMLASVATALRTIAQDRSGAKVWISPADGPGAGTLRTRRAA